MVMSDLTRSKLLELVADLRSEKARLEKQFQAEIGKIDNDLGAVQRTLDLLSDGASPVKQSKSQFELTMLITPLIAKARSQTEALKIIAQQSKSRIINATRAADILIRAGRAKGKRRNLVGTIYGILNYSDEWERVSPGNFRLKQNIF